MVSKVGGAYGRQPMRAPARADRQSSRQVFCELWDCFGRRQVSPSLPSLKPAKQSVLQKGWACPTHRRSHKRGDGAGVKSVLLLIDRRPHTRTRSPTSFSERGNACCGKVPLPPTGWHMPPLHAGWQSHLVRPLKLATIKKHKCTLGAVWWKIILYIANNSK